ncbi:DEAD/DEAH box helicase [Bailinhaonella thermotolerans]|uniref:DEAD/DEAH box helicase n=1 Tax=Bailinhaonella thermotolerans TaxID=1070861 RepID=A0A3A4A567_9ACTN|nr:DEAD/DEAH box helicase [Bailinhaonella thermotolerans]RJL23976.1 DEAD/DEAH box helicase [Bailinhaonella thermotolerans]
MPRPVTATRPVGLSREGQLFRLVFAYRPDLVERAQRLPYARFDAGAGRSWTCLVCAQSVEQLRRWHYEGLTDVSADELLAPGEDPPECADALLRPHTRARPFALLLAWRDEALTARLRAVPGAARAGTGTLTFPPGAAAALAELVQRGIVEDPDQILRPAEVTIAFDIRTGGFACIGDPRAQKHFDAHFPARDVVAAWRDKGLEVDFADAFSREVYRGELARVGPGVQPYGMALELRDYQKRAVAVGLERSGLAVFDEPGVGKTPAAIGLGHELLHRGVVERVVVSPPGGIRSQWRQEIVKFTGCDPEEIVVVAGGPGKRAKAYAEAADRRWLIVHHDVLHRDLEQIAPLVRGVLLVVDEAHRFTNPRAQRTQALRRLIRRCARQLVLTGTPAENNPAEWYAVLGTLAVPGCLGGPADFLNRYRYPRMIGGRQAGYEGERNLPELRARSAPHFLRRTKAEVVAHLPPLRFHHLRLDPGPRFAAALRRAHQAARDEIVAAVTGGRLPEDAEDLAQGAEMTATAMLRLLCSSPRLVLGSQAASAQALRDSGLIPDADGPKLDELRVMAAKMQAAGERMVVFTFSRQMAALIGERLGADGIRHVLYTGDTSADARDQAVAAFTTPGEPIAGTGAERTGPTVFVATDAGAEGLNLGRCCSTLVNFDLPWTPGRLEQRSNRIHRADGAHSSYLVVNLTIAGTLEEGIMRLIERKAAVSGALFAERRRTAAITGRRNRSLVEQALHDWARDETAAPPRGDETGRARETDQAGEPDQLGVISSAPPAPPEALREGPPRDRRRGGGPRAG